MRNAPTTLKLGALAWVVIAGSIASCSRRSEPGTAHSDPAPTPRDHAARAQLDTDVLLERHRTMVIRGRITEQGATEVIAKLLYLEHQDATAPVALYIDSPGGYVSPSLAIRDTMDALKPPVYTHCLAEARGTALVLLAHGARGHRTASASARFELTPTRTEQASAGDVARTDAIVNGMLATDTGRSIDDVARDVASGRQFDVDAARSFGLIDSVEE